MELWQFITAAILGNMAALAVLGWLGKSLLEKLIQRDSKRFEIELKAKADSTIEQLKSDLQLRTIEHQIRFSRLHEKQATVIADLNAHVVEALWEAESFLSPIEWVGEPNKHEKHKAAMDKLVDLYRYFNKHRIYLPERLCSGMEQLVTDVRSHVVSFGVYLPWDDASLPDHTKREKQAALLAGWNAIRNQVPPVKRNLEDEFRALLGPGPFR